MVTVSRLMITKMEETFENGTANNDVEVLVVPKTKTKPPDKTKFGNGTNGEIRFTIDWDVPRPSSVSDLIKSQINLRNHEEKLKETKETSAKVREELDDNWRRISEKKDQLRSMFVEFDKLGSKEKQERTIMRHINEKKLEEELEKEIEKVRIEVTELRAATEKMDSYYQQFRIFPEYLQRVVDSTDEFGSVQDIVNRYETLKENHDKLKQQIEDDIKGMVEIRAVQEQVLEDKSAEIASLTNKLVELRSRAETAKNERLNWQLVLDKVKSVIAEKYLEQKLIKTSIWDLYQQMCRRRKLPETAAEDNIDEQLAFIAKTLIHYKRVVSIATRENILCARSYVPNSSNLSANKP